MGIRLIKYVNLDTEVSLKGMHSKDTEPKRSPSKAANVEAKGVAETVSIELATITKADRFQVRQKTDNYTINRYADVIKAGGTMPPVKLARVTIDKDAGPLLVAVDGFHRIAAHEKLGRQIIEATIQEMTPEEAEWEAARANMCHGLPLTKREIREVFRRFIRANQHIGKGRRGKGDLMSYREIGQVIGATHGTIRNWMRQDFPRVYAEMGEKVEDVDWSDRIKVVEASPGELLDVDANPVTNLEAALKAYQATTDPVLRGQAVYLAKQIAEQMYKAGGWVDMTPEF